MGVSFLLNEKLPLMSWKVAPSRSLSISCELLLRVRNPKLNGPVPVRSRHFDPDVRPRVSRSHDQNAPILQLRRVPVFVRVQLQNSPVEVPRKRRHFRPLIVGHRHHNLVRFIALLARLHLEPLSIVRKRLNPRP